MASSADDAPLRIEARLLPEGALLTLISPPVPHHPLPRSIVYVIDTSGSMGVAATVNEGGRQVDSGQSILSLVCASVTAALAVLGPNDTAAIVTFSSTATLVFPPERMDDAGKARARDVLRSLQPDGSTNLWGGIASALDTLLEQARLRPAHHRGRRVVRCIAVLTDGCPNVDPPNLAGHAASLRDHTTRHGTLAALHVFGFGSGINVELLEELAREGGGLFSFIASPDMVASSFVNAAANFAAACATRPRLLLCAAPPETVATAVPVGPTLPAPAYGSRLSVLIPRTPAGEPFELADLGRLSLSLSDGGPPINVEVIDNGAAAAPLPAPGGVLVAAGCALWRNRVVAGLREARRKGMLGDLPGALSIVRNLSESLRSASTEEPRLESALALLLGDVEGQVAIALSKQEYFSAWGSAFLLSLARSHEMQTCADFKSPGLQAYASPLFKEHQAAAETTFRATLAEAQLEARATQGNSNATGAYGGGGNATGVGNTVAAAFYNAAGGCVHGEGLISLPGGGVKRVRDVRVGDAVVAAAGGSAVGIVSHVLRTAIAPTTHCVALHSGLILTAWHPILLPDGTTWVFPARAPQEHVRSAGTAAMYGLKHVYSLALRADAEHVPSATASTTTTATTSPSTTLSSSMPLPYGVIVDGTPAITLGHGVQGHPILSHAYYSSRRVLEDAEAVEAWCVAHGGTPGIADIGSGAGAAWGWGIDTTTHLTSSIVRASTASSVKAH